MDVYDLLDEDNEEKILQLIEQEKLERYNADEFRKYQGFTDDDEEYIRLVLKGYEYGVIPKNTTKGIKQKIEKEINPLKVLAILKRTIPYNILSAERPYKPIISSKREIILSEYLAGEGYQRKAGQPVNPIS